MIKKLPQTSLVILIEHNSIFLAMKKRGFGAGRWNGYGGKPEKNETIEDTAIRETVEESGVTPMKLNKVAIVNFHFPKDRQKFDQQTHIYICKDWTGEPTETEEMKPQKFNIEDIPYDDMWPDDRYWLPKVLAGESIEADFYFGDNDRILKKQIRQLLS
jgi:8-oxo-dGTP diphosphatase/2-hydroxy-dATP diphosphatase